MLGLSDNTRNGYSNALGNMSVMQTSLILEANFSSRCPSLPGHWRLRGGTADGKGPA